MLAVNQKASGVVWFSGAQSRTIRKTEGTDAKRKATWKARSPEMACYGVIWFKDVDSLFQDRYSGNSAKLDETLPGAQKGAAYIFHNDFCRHFQPENWTEKPGKTSFETRGEWHVARAGKWDPSQVFCLELSGQES
jgi:hypothetical protein